MAHKIITMLSIVLLTSCVTAPNYETGQDCWRTGVATENTGRMTDTPILDIPVIAVNLEELYAACGLPAPPALSWSNRGDKEIEACFVNDTIYILRGSKRSYVLNHERCHALLGSEHNSCYGRYAQWGKEIQSACEWND